MSTRVLDASSVGLMARETLELCTSATVLAAFERSFYLDVGESLIAVLAADFPDGPLNLRVPDLSTVDIAPGQRWTLARDCLRSDDGLIIDLAKARIWRPPDAGIAHLSNGREGLDVLLQDLAAFDLPKDGLIRLALDNAKPETLVERAAAAPLAHLTTTLTKSFRGEPVTFDSAPKIIGLGPGLTPSGDDLIGGALITCHHLGERQTAKLLGEAVNAVADATNRISQAHLAAAAEGYGAAPLHDLLHAVSIPSQRGPRRAALDAVARIGHSSGFDALAGIILTLRAWLTAQA